MIIVVGGFDHFVKQIPIYGSHIVNESPYYSLSLLPCQ
jgi:hypothetical protein